MSEEQKRILQQQLWAICNLNSVLKFRFFIKAPVLS